MFKIELRAVGKPSDDEQSQLINSFARAYCSCIALALCDARRADIESPRGSTLANTIARQEQAPQPPSPSPRKPPAQDEYLEEWSASTRATARRAPERVDVSSCATTGESTKPDPLTNNRPERTVPPIPHSAESPPRRGRGPRLEESADESPGSRRGCPARASRELPIRARRASAPTSSHLSGGWRISPGSGSEWEVTTRCSRRSPSSSSLGRRGLLVWRFTPPYRTLRAARRVAAATSTSRASATRYDNGRASPRLQRMLAASDAARGREPPNQTERSAVGAAARPSAELRNPLIHQPSLDPCALARAVEPGEEAQHREKLTASSDQVHA